MNIKKILKFYLVLTLSITAMSLLSYSDLIRSNASHYYANTLNALDSFFDDSEYKYLEEKAIIYNRADVSKTPKKDFKKTPEGFTFSIGNTPEKAYALAGSRMAEIMDLDFKTMEKTLKIKSIKFTIEGVSQEDIEEAYLFSEDEIVSTAKKGNNKLFFDGMNHEIEPNGSEVLTVKLNLSHNLKTGNRVRLDIMEPGDLAIELDDDPIQPSKNYPINGRYLSITSPRLKQNPVVWEVP